MQNSGRSSVSLLQTLLKQAPPGVFGGKDQAGKASELQANATAVQMQNTHISPRQPEAWTTYLQMVGQFTEILTVSQPFALGEHISLLMWSLYASHPSSECTVEAACLKVFDFLHSNYANLAEAGDLHPVALGLAPTEHATNRER